MSTADQRNESVSESWIAERSRGPLFGVGGEIFWTGQERRISDYNFVRETGLIGPLVDKGRLLGSEEVQAARTHAGDGRPMAPRGLARSNSMRIPTTRTELG